MLPGAVPEAGLTWTAPPVGTVTIYQHAAPSPWPAGTVLRPDELARLGRPVAGAAGSGESGINRTTVALPSGRTWFTAVTSGVGRAVLGATTEVSAMAAVRDLQARRYGTGIQLSWDWPDGCHECQVGWHQAGSPAQAADRAICGDWEFRNHGGFLVEPGPGPVTVWVRAILSTPKGLTASAAEAAEVPGADVIVGNHFQPARPAARSTRPAGAHGQPAARVSHAGSSGEEGPGCGEPAFRTCAMSLAQAQTAHVPAPTGGPATSWPAPSAGPERCPAGPMRERRGRPTRRPARLPILLHGVRRADIGFRCSGRRGREGRAAMPGRTTLVAAG